MATIRDVARAAGVSIATVSRVFNGSPRVDEQTARRVRKAAGELDYWPNSAARSLTTSRTQTLGVLLPDPYGEFFSEVIRGIDRAARLQNHQILISSSHANLDEVVSAARAMRGRIDGLILMASDEGSTAGVDRISRWFPVVLMNPRRECSGCSSISLANHAGARAVMDHLLQLGHRVIATITGPEGNGDAEERLRGYRDALINAGITPAAELEIPGDFTELGGWRAVDRIRKLTPAPTAVFAANDSMAVGLLSGLRTAGVDVPGEMAIVGFDDTTIARYLDPPLTTVKVDMYRLGQRAVQLLLAAVTAGDSRSNTRDVLPLSLVVRESCGVGPQHVHNLPEQGSVGLTDGERR